MKIAIDCHTLEIGDWAGKEQLVASLIKELSLADERNEYCLYFRHRVSRLVALPPNFKVLAMGIPTPFWQLAVLWDMFFNKVDLLYVPCTYLLPAINFFIPQVVNVCDMTTFLPGVSASHKRSTRLRERLLLKMAINNSRMVTVISQSTKRDLLSFFDIEEGKVTVVYPGAKGDFRIIDDRGYLNDISAKYELPKKFILSVGTLEPRKNGINLIKAYEKYVAETVDGDMNLVFVGKKGWFYDDLLRQAQESDLNNRIVFMDYVSDDDLAAFYNLAFCLAYPSFYEGFGLPIVEAMACGCPVVTSNTSSMPEIAGECAIIVDPNEPSRISDGFKRLAMDYAFRDGLVLGGLARARIFTYKEMAKQWLKSIMDCVNR